MGSINLDSKQDLIVNLGIKNILINAGAGTGKTRVLTERIINKICSGFYKIDEILVVTFTRAAAKEMKDRIILALEKALEDNPNNDSVAYSILNIDKAEITTIDAFCNKVLKENYINSNISSNYRLLDDKEEVILSYEVIDEVFEKEYKLMYEGNNEDFKEFVDKYCADGNDTDIKELIINVAYKSFSNANYLKWLDETANFECIEKFYDDIFKEFIDYVYELDNFIKENSIKVNRKILDEILKLDNAIENFREIFTPNKLLTRPPANDIIKEYYAKINKLSNILYFSLNIKSDINNLKPYYNIVIELTKKYIKRFLDIKKKKSAYSFNDIEHFALNLLNEDGKKTETAIRLSDKYKEIYVDEYQDINDIQEKILTSIAQESPNGNMFMVGDMKQSIYRFRASNPDIFNNKYEKFSKDTSHSDVCLTMGMNYRSNCNVINTVNDIFFLLMKKHIGGVEFDENQKLGSKSIITHKLNNKIVEINNDTDKELNNYDCIANYIANEIINIKDNYTYSVLDADGNELENEKKYKFKDFVVLMRTKKEFDRFAKVFQEHNIPYFVKSQTGFLETKEIRTVISFLRIIDNPYIDIDFVGVLFSDFVGLSVDDLTLLSKYSGDSIFDKINDCILRIDDVNLSNKLTIFMEKYNKIFKLQMYINISELIEKLYDEFLIPQYFSALSNGDVRKANLEFLHSIATDYISTDDISITGFINYIQDLEKRETKLGEAVGAGSDDDVVVIRTIHDSKGTENKVVFVAGQSKEFEKEKSPKFSKSVDSKYGFLLPLYNDTGEFIIKDNSISNYFKYMVSNEELGEWIRLLYVALTRAEHCFYSVNIKSKEVEEIVSIDSVCNSSKKTFTLNKLLIGVNELLKTKMEITEINYSDIINRINIDNVDIINRSTTSTDLINRIKKFIKTYKEPVKSKLLKINTVSGLKNIETDDKPVREEENEELILKKFSGYGAKYGSAVHQILKFIDFNNPLDEKSKFSIDNLIKYYGKIYEVKIDKKVIINFLESSLGQLCKKAYNEKKLYREEKFMQLIDNSILDIGNDEKKLLLKGMFDGFILEDDYIILFDYKTDKIKDENYFVKMYSYQLSLYKQALEKIFMKEVKYTYIYSSELNTIINLS